MAAVEPALTPEIREDFLTCTFCRLPFSHPKALPCLHTFCKNCLSVHILKHALPAQDGTSCVHCPICQQLCDLPQDGIEGLQDNVLVRSILAMINTKALQICEPCTDDGQHKGADFCCTKCEEFLCEPCAITHKRTRGTKEHVVLDVRSLRELCRLVNQDQPGRPVLNVRLLARFGCHEHDLFNPIAITINMADDVMVSQSNAKVSIFTGGGQVKKAIDQHPYMDEDDQFTNRGIGITSEGYLAVVMRKELRTTNAQGQTIIIGAQVCTIQSMAGREIGTCVVKTKTPEECQPHGLAVTSTNHIIVSDVGRHCIYVFDAEYKMVKNFGKRGSRGSKQFKYPYHVATNTNRDIIVSDYGNHCVKVFQFSNLSCKMTIGSNGSLPGQFMHPMGVCADKFGNIFVADRDNHRVQMFDPNGQFLANVLQETFDRGEDVRPLDLCMTSNSSLVVLLTGVEGVDFAQICMYQLRSTKIPLEQYRLQQEKLRLEAQKRKEEEEKRQEEEERKREEGARKEEQEANSKEEEPQKESTNEVTDLRQEVKSGNEEAKHKEEAATPQENGETETKPTNEGSPNHHRNRSTKRKGSTKRKPREPSSESLTNGTSSTNEAAPALVTKRPAVLPPIRGTPVPPTSSSGAPGKHVVQPDVVLQSIAESIIFDPDKEVEGRSNKKENNKNVEKGKEEGRSQPTSASSSRRTSKAEETTEKKKDPSQVCSIL